MRAANIRLIKNKCYESDRLSIFAHKLKLMIRTLIFDFDGTLADTTTAILTTTHTVFDKLGLLHPTDGEIRRLIGLPLKEMFLCYKSVDNDEVAQHCCDTYNALFDSVAEHSFRLFPHVAETLHDIRRNTSMKIITASSRSVRSQEHLLNLTGTRNCFDLLCGPESVKHPKPAPDMVLHILNITDTSPSEALVIGDATYDILMGKRAACRTCATIYGNHTREQLLEMAPDFIIDDFRQIKKLIDELCTI